MAQPTYLESFLESVDDLPNDLQRKLQLIRELDEQSQGLVESIEKSAEDYMQLRKKPKQTEDAGMLRQIRKDQKTVVDLGDEKVALAVQVYELVCFHPHICSLLSLRLQSV
jgi:inhibitor of growth protein 4